MINNTMENSPDESLSDSALDSPLNLATAAALLASLRVCDSSRGDDSGDIQQLLHNQNAPYRPERLLPRSEPSTCQGMCRVVG